MLILAVFPLIVADDFVPVSYQANFVYSEFVKSEEPPVLASLIEDGYIAQLIPENTATGQNIASESIKALIRSYPWDADIMIRIFTCESNLNPDAVNYKDAEITGFPSWGIAQLNRPKFDGWNDPKTNLDEAFKLWERRKIQPWTCARILKII